MRAICVLLVLAGHAVADPFVASDKIRYAAKTAPHVEGGANADYFSIVEDEQTFFIGNGDGPDAAAASKQAAAAFDELYKKTVDTDATWPHAQNTMLSWVENRIVAALQLANERLHADHRRATAVAAVVSGGQLTIAHVGVDRAYLVRNGGIKRLTIDHTIGDEYLRDHPDASEDEMRNLPRKTVRTRALGRRVKVDIDVATSLIERGDLVVLASEGLGVLDDALILRLVGKSVATADLEQAVARLVERGQQTHAADVTVIVLGFAAKP
jgi:serine/threonine protein phosphatase PrpC